MLLAWLRRRRRRKIAARPFPEHWEEILRHNVRQYASLGESERQTLHTAVAIFIAEKSWEGCNGLEITDEIRVTIAGHACRLVLGFQGYVFDRLQTILVYPDTYVVREKDYSLGFEIEQDSLRLGEAWHQGPVILVWPSVMADAHDARREQNVVLHEFAHVLDMHDHHADGTPPLDSPEHYQTWEHVMRQEFAQLVDDIQTGRPTLLDQYGATNLTEFFAVCSECFFESPQQMREHHERLYDVLRGFYHQDPAGS